MAIPLISAAGGRPATPAGAPPPPDGHSWKERGAPGRRIATAVDRAAAGIQGGRAAPVSRSTTGGIGPAA
ncbi:MAG: hypothetical protein JW839_07190 [Candidatus Lokiarchaeota archaeon]|nr:hypothetical protein [Candidatus Lokiarchaeota archaeon]